MKLVEIWRTTNELEATMLQAALEDKGIKSILSGGTVGRIYGLNVDGLAEVRVMVRSEDEAAARAECAEFQERHFSDDFPPE